MAWLELSDAVDSVVVKAGNIGAHVFYDKDIDKFSVAQGSKNRAEILRRIEDSPDQYRGFWRGGVSFNEVLEDLEYVRQESGN